MASRIDNITYVVMFQVKAGLSALERREVFDNLYALKNKSVNTSTNKPYIKSIIGGKDNSISNLADGITHIFIIEFETTADRDFFVNEDAEHKAYNEKIAPLVEKTQVVNFTPYKF